MGEKTHIAIASCHSIDYAAGPFSYLNERFAIHNGRQPDGPLRVLLAYFERRPTLIDSVIPLAEIVIDLVGRKTSQTSSFPGAL